MVEALPGGQKGHQVAALLAGGKVGPTAAVQVQAERLSGAAENIAGHQLPPLAVGPGIEPLGITGPQGGLGGPLTAVSEIGGRGAQKGKSPSQV